MALHPKLAAEIQTRRWWTIEQAAPIIGVCPATVRQRILSGAIRAYQQARTYKITAEDLQEYMESRAVEPRSADGFQSAAAR